MAFQVDSIPFSSASATLGNSRLSYRAGIFGTQNSGDVTITIDTSSQPDNNNFHIFPKDTVCFTNGAESGCQGQTRLVRGAMESAGWI